MAPVQIKVVYDYYSAKRTTPFFITEEELLDLDFRVDFDIRHFVQTANDFS